MAYDVVHIHLVAFVIGINVKVAFAVKEHCAIAAAEGRDRNHAKLRKALAAVAADENSVNVLLLLSAKVSRSVIAKFENVYHTVIKYRVVDSALERAKLVGLAPGDAAVIACDNSFVILAEGERFSFDLKDPRFAAISNLEAG